MRGNCRASLAMIDNKWRCADLIWELRAGREQPKRERERERERETGTSNSVI